ncbi:MAG: signal peptidase I [Deltaproteobacteria bacterium]|nr:signal peptidase I [Candidatus Zymogenaceae bacterium]
MIKEENEVRKSRVREFTESLVLALMMAFIVMTFIVQSFEIPSGSMIPTLLLGDRILVNKFIFGTRVPFTGIKLLPLREPARGEIIVFLPPRDFESPLGRGFHLIKRVIGLPGDTIEIVDKRLYVNGAQFPVPNAHWDDPAVIDRWTSVRDNFGPIVVPPDFYFMMGDNRDNSYDSRFWGFVPEEDLTGKPIMIYWSWDITSTSVLGRVRSIRWERIGDVFHKNGEIGRATINRVISGRKIP